MQRKNTKAAKIEQDGDRPTVRKHLLFPPALAKKIEAIAARDRRGFQNMIHVMCEDWIAEDMKGAE